MVNRRNIRAVTLKTVAEDAGVSVSTVCHVLRGRARLMRIAPESEARIREAARRLGYLGNHHARSLVMRSVATVGLTAPPGHLSFLDSTQWSHIVGGIEVQVRVRGYDLHVIGGGQVEDLLQLAHGQILAGRIDCLVVIRAMYRQIPDVLLTPRLPVVFIGADTPSGCASTWLDPDPGLAEAVMHLKQLGHRSITWFSTGQDSGRLMEHRLEQVRLVATRAGMSVETFVLDAHLFDTQHTQDTLQDLYEATRTQFRPTSGTTAIMCYNDALALVLLKALAGLGIEVPRDMSVIGFDDLFAQFTIPALTTVSHRFYDLGIAAVDLALELSQSAGRKKSARALLPSQLVIRSSTGPARQGA